MPKRPVRQSRTSRSRREVQLPQQPHITSFRLSPPKSDELNLHLADSGTKRSDFIRHAVTSPVRGLTTLAPVMPMAVTAS